MTSQSIYLMSYVIEASQFSHEKQLTKMGSEERELRLRSLYESSPAAFSTPARLQREARKAGIRISLPRLSQLMSSWLTYTKFRVKYKNPRLRDKVIVTAPNHLFQIDLCILPKYRNYIGLLVW